MNGFKYLIGILTTLLLAVTVFSCKKMEGTTGRTTVEGVVIEEFINGSGIKEREYPVGEERVYITYGDNEIYDDETRTQFDGKFKFEHLQKGDYSIYVYTECVLNPTTCPDGQTIIPIDFEVGTENNIVLDTIFIQKY